MMASITLSAMYWVGADSISALFGGGYGIRPYSLDQTMVKAEMMFFLKNRQPRRMQKI